MCIIAVSEIGHALPTDDIIEQMWSSNDDGAGFMWAANGRVYIRKGFMTLPDFMTAIRKLESEINVTDTSIVMHFRIGTHGGNVPANTHPFPITNNISLLQKLSCVSDTAIAHNGIIRCITPRQKISDTMEFVASVLNPLRRLNKNYYKSPDVQNLIETLLDGDRMVLLNGNGELTYFGNWVEDNGIKYSNHSYKTYKYEKWYDRYFDFNFNASDDVPKLVKKELCFVAEDTIVQDDSGRVYDDSVWDILADDNGNLYYYDYENDVAFNLDGWSAYTPNMNPYRPNEKPECYDIYDTCTPDEYTEYFSGGVITPLDD